MTTILSYKWISSCCRVMLAVLTVCCGVFVWPGLATKAIAEPVDEAAQIRVRQLGAAALTCLRDEDLPQALLALGEATDSLPAHASQNKADAGLVPAAAGLNRQLVRLKSDARFDLLYAWSMPTESRRTVRVLSSPVPNGAPPEEFARALGERPRNHSFAVAEANGVRRFSVRPGCSCNLRETPVN